MAQEGVSSREVTLAQRVGTIFVTTSIHCEDVSTQSLQAQKLRVHYGPILAISVSRYPYTSATVNGQGNCLAL